MPPLGAGTARSSGKGQHPERGHHRQETAPRAGPLLTPHHRQPTDRRTDRPETARRRSRRQLTGRSRRQRGRPERPGRPVCIPAKGTTRTTDQPPDPASRRDTTSNSKHKKHHRFSQNEEGREARTGRDTRHVCPSLAGATAGTPARRRRSPRPAARECAGRRRLRRQCARRYKLRAPAGARPQAAGRGPAWPLEAARAAAPLRRAASAQAEPPGTACAAGVAGLARLAEAPPTGPEGRTAPKPPLVGAGPPRSTCAATGTGEEQCKARRAAPQGLGLALRRGAPVQRLAANLTGQRLRWLGRHISPARPRRGLDGAGGGTAAAQGGQGVGPQAGGAGGTWPARRRDADGSPFPQAARPPERTKKGVPTGHSLLFLAR